MARSQFTNSSRIFTSSMGVQTVIAARSQFTTSPPTFKEIAVKSFCYESLMDLMEKAESLGWVDDFEDETGDYNSYVTDQIELECLDVLRDNGYNVIERMSVSL